MEDSIARRRVLRVAAGTALLAPATGLGAAHDEHDSEPEHTVVAGPGGALQFDPVTLAVDPGATVRWEWDSDGHNVNPTRVPDDAEWEGHPDVSDAGHVHEHTFEVEGRYEYECTPHAAAGMTAEVLVGDATSRPGPVVVGPGGDLVFEPEEVHVEVGETVRWEWDSDNHNVNPTSVPEDATWEGHPEVADPPNVYEHTFETEGRYEYECTPHGVAGMVGEVVVGDPAGWGSSDGTVEVGPGGSFVFEPEELHVEPGQTVRFEWDSDDHNVNPTSIPEDATWEGHPEVVDPPNVHEHTFDVEGVYEFECTPHVSAGMTGRIVVGEDAGGDAGDDGDGADDADGGTDDESETGDDATDGADGTENGSTTDGSADADDGSPGFGVPAALAALGGALAAFRQRIRGD